MTAAASNISMLSPQVSIYNASGTLLAQASNPSAWSDNVTASVPAVVPGQRYYMAVTGDTHTYFDAGAYQLVVSLPQSSPPNSPAPTPPPVVPTPTPTPQPPPIVSQPPPATNTSPQTATRLGRVTQTTLPNLGFNSGLTVEYFDFQSGAGGSLPDQRSGGFDPGVQRSRKVDCPGHEPGEPFQCPGGDGLLPQAQAGNQSSRDKLQPVDQPQVSTGDRSQDDATSLAGDGLDHEANASQKANQCRRIWMLTGWAPST